jgi:hypothetical protein
MQPVASKTQLRVRRLPWPRTPLRERRRDRSDDPNQAMRLALDRAARRGELDAVFIADDTGLLVAQSKTSVDLGMIAAVMPIVGRGKASARVKRNGNPREITVQTLQLHAQTLYVGALGGERGARMREVASSIAATRRILA